MSEHQVTLIFEDGHCERFAANDQQAMYYSARWAGIRLQSDCLEGACATCKALCTRGEVELLDYSDEALSRDERAQGLILACRALPRSDLVVEVPYESHLILEARAPRVREGRVAAIERVGATVVRLEVELPDADFGYLPGQYMHVGVPGTAFTRDYSFANWASEPRRLVFYVKLLQRGVMSEYLESRGAVGDRITLAGPYGQFYLRELRRPVLMVAGGTGLAPMLSMLDYIVTRGSPSQPVKLLYGVNAEEDLVALGELDAFAARGVPLTYRCAVMSPGPDWKGGAGAVTRLLDKSELHGGECDAYLCGPPPMVDAARDWLLANGLAPERIHAERFLPS